MTALLAVAVVVALAAGLGPKVFPYRTYEVLSGSMSPTLPVGALIVDLPVDASSIRAGDIITFSRPDNPHELVTHRVIGVEPGPLGPVFTTKGDANQTPDSWRVGARGTALRLALWFPLLGYLLGGIGSPLGLLLTLVLPALALVAGGLLELWRPARRAE